MSFSCYNPVVPFLSPRGQALFLYAIRMIFFYFDVTTIVLKLNKC